MAIAERIGGRRGPQGIQGEQGPAGEAGAPGVAGPSWVISGVNALGTSGTRYFYPAGYVNVVAATSVKRARMPFRGRATRMLLTNATAGFSNDGTGGYTLAFCRVESDTAITTPLSITLGVLDRAGEATGDSGILEQGEEWTIQVVLSGTVTNSPVDTFVTIIFEPEEE